MFVCFFLLARFLLRSRCESVTQGGANLSDLWEEFESFMQRRRVLALAWLEDFERSTGVGRCMFEVV